MSRTEDGGTGLDQGPVRTKDVGPRSSGRPKPDQPLRARWDPTDDSGRPRVDREAQPEYKKQSSLGRFVSTYGWRAYAIPVLTVLTIALIVVTIQDGRGSDLAPTAAVNPARGPIASLATR